MASADPDATRTPAPPRPSATVVLVRPATVAPEVLLVRRHPKTAFGAVYAFPGGVIEPSDFEVSAACRGVSAGQADATLGTDGDGLAYYSAAIRELFEETGVLLGRPGSSPSAMETARSALNAGELRWDRFVDAEKLQLDCDALHYFGFWITPATEPKRYSTRFFLAAMPAGQVAVHCGGELTDSCWLTANEALGAAREGALPLIYPTRKTLEQIAPFETAEPLIEWAQGAADRGVARIQPGRVPA